MEPASRIQDFYKTRKLRNETKVVKERKKGRKLLGLMKESVFYAKNLCPFSGTFVVISE